MDWAKTTARRDEKHLSFGIWCPLYQRFYGSFYCIHVTYLPELSSGSWFGQAVKIPSKIKCYTLPSRASYSISLRLFWRKNCVISRFGCDSTCRVLTAQYLYSRFFVMIQHYISSTAPISLHLQSGSQLCNVLAGRVAECQPWSHTRLLAPPTHTAGFTRFVDQSWKFSIQRPQIYICA